MKSVLTLSKLVLPAKSVPPAKWYWTATASALPAADALTVRPACARVAKSAAKKMLPIRIKSILVCQKAPVLARPHKKNFHACPSIRIALPWLFRSIAASN